MRLSIPLILSVLALLGCPAEQAEDEAEPPGGSSVDRVAEEYVKLVLALGQHDPDYVDAYYGPPQWREEAESGERSLADIRREAEALLAGLEAAPPQEDEMEQLRRRFLGRQLESAVARADLLTGRRMSFDEESEALYDAVAPEHRSEHFQNVLDALDRRLAGEGFGQGSVEERYEAYREGFLIPPDRVDAVFRAAIDACRARTVDHVELPAEESFEVEYVTDRSWAAYNWYRGGFHSVIQVNTDLPIAVDWAVDLACHEGYPGHHVFNVLLEKHLVRDRNWVELSVYPLFSPQSLIAEGTANFGIEVAFPGDERIRFEREVIFPLAGLDPDRAEGYYRIQELKEKLAFAGNEAARRYLDGEIDAPAAVDWLRRYALMSEARAKQRVRFVEQYRSYVINYNVGKELVRAYVESQGGTADAPEKRWELFEQLLSKPHLPSSLRREAALGATVASSSPW